MGERDIEWLSKQDAFEVGVKSERERIIALLEEQTSALSIGYPEWSIAEIIALIKGEN